MYTVKIANLDDLISVCDELDRVARDEDDDDRDEGDGGANRLALLLAQPEKVGAF